MKNEVKATLTLTPSPWFDAHGAETRTLRRSFDDCESAWEWICDTKRTHARRRGIADRQYMPWAAYYGETSTGKRYGGVYFINGAMVTPQNRDSLQSFRPFPFEMVEDYTERRRDTI